MIPIIEEFESWDFSSSNTSRSMMFVYIFLGGLLTTISRGSSMVSHVGAVRSEYAEIDELVFREKAMRVRGNTAIAKIEKLRSLMLTISELESRHKSLIIELSEEDWNLINIWWILLFNGRHSHQSFEEIVEEYACIYPEHVPGMLQQLGFKLMDHIGRGEQELLSIDTETAHLEALLKAHVGARSKIDSDVDQLIHMTGDIKNHFHREFYIYDRANQLKEYIMLDRVPRWEKNVKREWTQKKRDVLVQDCVEAYKNIVLGGNTGGLEAGFRFELSEIMKKNKVHTYASLSRIVVEALAKFEVWLEHTYTEEFRAAKRQYNLVNELILELKKMKYALAFYL